MAQSVRISDDLYLITQIASQAFGRPLAKQMEYGARLWAALDATGIPASMAMDLLGNGGKADEFVAAALGRGVLEDGGLPMLKERKHKDAADVAAGRRKARSLLAVGKSDLTGARFTPNPKSEFARVGNGW